MGSKTYDSKDVGPKGGKVTLPLASIQKHVNLRSRVGPLDSDHVAGMAESIREGHPPPRPLVYHISGQGHFLVGGWYTIAGYELAEIDQIPVIVKSGTWADAVVAAASQNQEHDKGGLKRSNADKRHAVTMVLCAHPEWADRKIETATGTSDWLVADARKKMAAQVPESGTPRFRVGLDNKQYPLPLPDRSRPSNRPERVDELQPSWDMHGASVLPLLKTGIPLPRVLAANQLNLKQLSCIIGRWLDLFDEPIYDDVLKRLLSAAEKASRLEWLITSTFPELYEADSNLGEEMEVLRDVRFPAGALP